MKRIIKGTRIYKIKCTKENERFIKEAADLIQKEDVVAFPTETVYGLGANALSKNAVKKIFQTKGRPMDNPLIVHVASINSVYEIVEKVTNEALKLMEKYWPGALTIILPKKSIIPDCVTGNLKNVAVRMPKNKIALELIRKSKVPIAAPSANISGKPSPTTAEHVIKDLSGKIPLILDGGRTDYGLESTVIDMTSETPTILRPGSVTYESLNEAINKVKNNSTEIKENPSSNTPKSPGVKYAHYCPEAPMILVEGPIDAIKNYINNKANEEMKNGKKVGIIATDQTIYSYNIDNILSAGDRDKPKTIASNLFLCLRKLDNLDIDLILAEGIKEEGIGRAIMNRLRKSSGFNIVKL